ncbi:hypothetical protein SH611_16550 [Geminicoccaceae bacterium 1502E]|nr:hypothetical protein [Geminicoccaceae bacterium 1502E]
MRSRTAAFLVALSLTGAAQAAGLAALTDNYAASGAVVPGDYACVEFRGQHPSALSGTSSRRFSTRFTIAGDGSYAYRGTQMIPGTWEIDPASGAITWTSGPFAPDADGASVSGWAATRKSDGKPAIVLVYHLPKFGDSPEYCAPVS